MRLSLLSSCPSNVSDTALLIARLPPPSSMHSFTIPESVSLMKREKNGLIFNEIHIPKKNQRKTEKMEQLCAIELTSSFVSGLVGCVLCLAVVIPHIFSSVLRADGGNFFLLYYLMKLHNYSLTHSLIPFVA